MAFLVVLLLHSLSSSSSAILLPPRSFALHSRSRIPRLHREMEGNGERNGDREKEKRRTWRGGWTSARSERTNHFAAESYMYMCMYIYIVSMPFTLSRRRLLRGPIYRPAKRLETNPFTRRTLFCGFQVASRTTG